MEGDIVDNLVGKKVKVIEKEFEGIEGIITVYERDTAMREVVRLNITKGKTAITDYFLKDVQIIE